MEHVDSRINEMVVMYQSAEQVIRPSAPPDVSVCKDIMSCFSFLFLGVPRHYVKRPFSFGARHARVCEHALQTAWTEDLFTVTSSVGIRNHEKRVADIVERELKRAKPGAWCCVQAREELSTEEEAHRRPHQVLRQGQHPRR
jgi:hypothetical protein